MASAPSRFPLSQAGSRALSGSTSGRTPAGTGASASLDIRTFEALVQSWLERLGTGAKADAATLATFAAELLYAVESRRDPVPPEAQAAPPARDSAGAALLRSVGMVFVSSGMQEVANLVRLFAPATNTVLVRGESGTGKEMVARAIHVGSPRRARPFVTTNCAAIPEGLAESELFGHRRGAFTDAVRDQQGLFQLAHGGTLFLDEVGELAMALQAKVLRALELGQLQVLGGPVVRVNVRVVAATNSNLEERVKAGLFREDLYYRLCQGEVSLPPLRDRPEDIPVLTRLFLSQLKASGALQGSDQPSPELLERLAEHEWPGNVRELKSTLERLVVTSGRGPLNLDNLVLKPPTWRSPGARAPEEPKPMRLADIEKAAVLEAFRLAGGVRKAAAELLGITDRQMQSRIARCGVLGLPPANATPVPPPATFVPLHNREKAAIQQALRTTAGNARAAARILGISDFLLASKMKRLGLSRDDLTSKTAATDR